MAKFVRSESPNGKLGPGQAQQHFDELTGCALACCGMLFSHDAK
jgi:hypothetical protein